MNFPLALIRSGANTQENVLINDDFGPSSDLIVGTFFRAKTRNAIEPAANTTWIKGTGQWEITSSELQNLSSVNGVAGESGVAIVVDTSTVPETNELNLSLTYTLGDPNETLYFHLWGVVKTAGELVETGNGNEGNDTLAHLGENTAVNTNGKLTDYSPQNTTGLPDVLAVYDLYTGSPSIPYAGWEALNPTFSVTGGSGEYTRILSLADHSINSLDQYDYLLFGMTRNVAGASSSARISNVELTYSTIAPPPPPPSGEENPTLFIPEQTFYAGDPTPTLNDQVEISFMGQRNGNYASNPDARYLSYEVSDTSELPAGYPEGPGGFGDNFQNTGGVMHLNNLPFTTGVIRGYLGPDSHLNSPYNITVIVRSRKSGDVTSSYLEGSYTFVLNVISNELWEIDSPASLGFADSSGLITSDSFGTPSGARDNWTTWDKTRGVNTSDGTASGYEDSNTEKYHFMSADSLCIGVRCARSETGAYESQNFITQRAPLGDFTFGIAVYRRPDLDSAWSYAFHTTDLVSSNVVCALSGDGSYLVISHPNDVMDVYSWNGSSYVQHGNSISLKNGWSGTQTNFNLNLRSVCISDDGGLIVAVDAKLPGRVGTYNLVDGVWTEGPIVSATGNRSLSSIKFAQRDRIDASSPFGCRVCLLDNPLTEGWLRVYDLIPDPDDLEGPGIWDQPTYAGVVNPSGFQYRASSAAGRISSFTMSADGDTLAWSGVTFSDVLDNGLYSTGRIKKTLGSARYIDGAWLFDAGGSQATSSSEHAFPEIYNGESTFLSQNRGTITYVADTWENLNKNAGRNDVICLNSDGTKLALIVEESSYHWTTAPGETIPEGEEKRRDVMQSVEYFSFVNNEWLQSPAISIANAYEMNGFEYGRPLPDSDATRTTRVVKQDEGYIHGLSLSPMGDRIYISQGGQSFEIPGARLRALKLV